MREWTGGAGLAADTSQSLTLIIPTGSVMAGSGKGRADGGMFRKIITGTEGLTSSQGRRPW